jgi:YHS domain-containing protein
MKTSGEKKTGKKSGKKKGKIEEWFINILAIVLLGGGIVLIVVMTAQMGSHNDPTKDSYLASLPSQKDTIPHNKICMVDDIYQGNYPTLPLALNNRTYYGCDAKAINSLTTKSELRTALDPVNHQKIDKASAIIAINPKRDGKVLYFESMETFNQYLNSLPNQ